MKGQHLSEVQKAYLAQKLEVSPDQKIKTMKLYKLSESTIRRIVRERKRNSSEATPNIKERNDDMRLSRDAEFVLRNFVKPPTTSVSLRKIQRQIQEDTKECYSIHTLRRFLKEKLKYRYKKGLSRPIKYRANRVQSAKSLF